MEEAGFPGQHTTTTTVTSNTTVQTNLRFDKTYFRTFPGILKVVQITSSILGFICIQSTLFRYLSEGAYFSWISMIAFWFSLILLIFYLFHIVEKSYKIPWLKIEFGFCALWAILYAIAAGLALSIHVSAFSAAAFFGFVAMAAYALDAAFKFYGIRTGGLAQGTRVVTKTTSTPERPEGY